MVFLSFFKEEALLEIKQGLFKRFAYFSSSCSCAIVSAAASAGVHSP